MKAYKAPVSDVLFLLEDVFAWDAHREMPGFGDLDLSTVASILGEAARLCEETLAPLNASGDLEGCRWDAGVVRTPAGFREAYSAYAAGGWIGLSAPVEFGGQGLPYTLAAIVNEFTASANLGFVNYPGLTQSAITAIAASAPPELQRIYLPPLIAGRWTGAMCLTEPHCGTDLGLIRARATPLDDGACAIAGQKIFVTGGEHDLAENIVHMVLARIEGAPAGVRGLSLFIAPKFAPDEKGEPGARNAFACGSIEKKMGIHASATCTIDYDGARGFLVGEPHRGLQAMFVMMNEARLGVATQGLAISEAACQKAAAYARERLQGRALGGPGAPEKPADPIIAHQDVRRMLLDMRSFNEAARALMICVALNVDIAARAADPDARRRADDFVSLMTPVLKGVFTDRGFDNAVSAQQVFGGHGYIIENGVEQFVRDARIAMIYEGANGVQAMDLVMRKLPRDGGRAISAFLSDVGAFVREREGEAALRTWIAPLASGLADLRKATLWFMDNAMARPQNAAAGAYDYMHLLGLVAMGWMQARIAEAALGRQVADPATARAMNAKLVAARWFMERIIPETALRLARISSGACTMSDMPDEAF
ncbi:MAG: acyl-CoA dehydrogenase C-terminal domain-containing protein [Beijerinckiaceae bacterium]